MFWISSEPSARGEEFHYDLGAVRPFETRASPIRLCRKRSFGTCGQWPRRSQGFVEKPRPGGRQAARSASRCALQGQRLGAVRLRDAVRRRSASLCGGGRVDPAKLKTREPVACTDTTAGAMDAAAGADAHDAPTPTCKTARRAVSHKRPQPVIFLLTKNPKNPKTVPTLRHASRLAHFHVTAANIQHEAQTDRRARRLGGHVGRLAGQSPGSVQGGVLVECQRVDIGAQPSKRGPNAERGRPRPERSPAPSR